MKKIVIIILCMLCLSGALFAFAACQPKPKDDPYVNMYAEYYFKEERITDITNENDKWVLGGPNGRKIPEAVAEKVAEIKNVIGNTVNITKEKIRFSKDGQTKAEFNYSKHSAGGMTMEVADDFPLQRWLEFHTGSYDEEGKHNYSGFDAMIRSIEINGSLYEIVFKFVKTEYL